FHAGDAVELEGMTAEVETVLPDGRPKRVRFRFDRDLSAPSLVWTRWDRLGFVPSPPPAVGATARLPSIDAKKALLRDGYGWARPARADRALGACLHRRGLPDRVPWARPPPAVSWTRRRSTRPRARAPTCASRCPPSGSPRAQTWWSPRPRASRAPAARAAAAT